jgi:thymidine kinase
MRPGQLIVIRGCMFSGKSERLIARLEAACSQGRSVAAFKHASDDRYAARQIVTHSGLRIDAVPVSEPARILPLVPEDALVGIDEAQFFSGDLIDVCRALLERGCDVVVAGLDLDSWGEPFGPMPGLAAIASEIVQMHARCARCGRPADHTQRLAPVEGQKMVGGPESYEPRCAACFEAPPVELRR